MRFDQSPGKLKEAQDHCDRLLKDEGIIIQEYLKYVEILGEISCCFYGNTLANVVQKIAVKGDYRVMDDFGGTDRRAIIDREGLRVCHQALEAVPFD